MRQRLFIGLLLGSLASASAADDLGWFLETPAEQSAHYFTPAFSDGAYPPGSESLLQLRAGIRFSESFTLSADLGDYLLDLTRGGACAATDFICMSARDRGIEYGRVYDVALAPALQLDEGLSLYGQLGLRGWDVQVGGDVPDRRELMFGVGLRYDISNPFKLQLEYQELDLDIKLTSIGFTWRF